MTVLDLLLGRPLASDEARGEQIGSLLGVPVFGLDALSSAALRFALKISPHVRAVHVDCGEGASTFRQEWRRLVDEPTREAGMATPKLVVLPSHYRYILFPMSTTFWRSSGRVRTTRSPFLSQSWCKRRWYHHFLHHKRAAVLKSLLLPKGNQRIVVINVPMVSRIVRALSRRKYRAMTSGAARFFVRAAMSARVAVGMVDGFESRQRTIGSAWSSDESALESRLRSCPI